MVCILVSILSSFHETLNESKPRSSERGHDELGWRCKGHVRDISQHALCDAFRDVKQDATLPCDGPQDDLPTRAAKLIRIIVIRIVTVYRTPKPLQNLYNHTMPPQNPDCLLWEHHSHTQPRRKPVMRKSNRLKKEAHTKKGCPKFNPK